MAKCIAANNPYASPNVDRVSDAEAAEKVATGEWHYISKGAYCARIKDD